MITDPSAARAESDRALNWETVVGDVEDGHTVEIRRGGKPVAVMMGYDDYRALRRAVDA